MRILQLDPSAEEPRHAVRAVRFRADGRVFAASVGPERAVADVLWWNLGTDRLVERSTPEPDVDSMYTGGESREEYPDPVPSPDLELVAWTVLAFEDEGECVLIHDVWSKPPRQELARSLDPFAKYRCLAFHPTGETVFAAGFRGDPGAPTVFRWDIEEVFDADPFGEEGAELEPIELPDPEAAPTCLGFSPDGRTLAVGLDRGAVLLYDLSLPGTPPRTLVLADRDDRLVRETLFAPDGTRLFVRTDSVLTLFDLRNRTGRDSRAVTPMTGFAVSPDGRTLAVSHRDGTVAFLDAATLEERRRFRWDIGALHCVAFAPDGLTCLAGADLARVILWDVDA